MSPPRTSPNPRGIVSRRLIALGGMVLGLLAADSREDVRTLVPPPIPGEVYAVVGFAPGSNTGAPTYVEVVWGSWSKRELFAPAALPGSTWGGSGVTIRLQHFRGDTVPLTVRTNGTLVTGPYQGPPPAAWEDPAFTSVAW